MIFLLWSVFILASCEQPKTAKPMTKAELDHKVDSIMQIKGPKLIKEMEADFEVRKSLIIKPKVDSILGISDAVPKINYPQDALIDAETDNTPTHYDSTKTNNTRNQ